MQSTVPTDPRFAELGSAIEPAAVYQALWQDDSTGRAVMAVSASDEFCFVSVNGAITNRFFGKIDSVDQLPIVNILGKKIVDIFPEQMAQQLYRYCRQCVQTQQSVEFELCASTEQSPNRWWHLNLCPIKSETQQVHQLVLSATDVSAFKQTELDLKSAAQDVRNILDKVQESVFIHDLDGTVLDVNDSVLALYRITREEALRYSFEEDYSVPESPIHLLPDLWQRALQGERVTIDWPSRRPSDDTRLSLEVVLQCVVLSGQMRIIACIRDVTERKQLEDRQNRLLAIIEATPDLIGMADAQGNNLYLNQAGQRLLGLSDGEASQFHIGETIPAHQKETFEKTILPQVIEQGSWSGELSMMTCSGEELPTSQVLIAHKDESGELQYLSTTARDIRDLKAVEANLRNHRQFLDSIYRGADVVIFAWDLINESTQEVRCSGWNPACAAATGLSEKTVLGKTPTEVFGPDGGSAVLQKYLQCINQQQPMEYEEEIVFDGSPTWWMTKLNPIRDENDQYYRIVGTTVSITESKLHTMELKAYSKLQAQQSTALESALSELKQTQAQIVHSEKMSSLGQMVAGIAHEINNPVNFIHANVKPAHGYASELLELIELYQKEYPQPSSAVAEMLEDLDIEFIQQDFFGLLESMKVGTQRIREIVLSLRNFSRLDESDVKAVDLHEGIDSTLIILSHKIKINLVQKPISIVKSYNLLPFVECYPSQLNQVVMNILANAIDALGSHEQPQIHIATQAQDDQAVITIADNGDGIPDAVRARIFDPFFTTKTVGKGTGMGLSISHQIITERHGGSLIVDSEPGKGTTFTIKIPLKQGTNT